MDERLAILDHYFAGRIGVHTDFTVMEAPLIFSGPRDKCPSPRTSSGVKFIECLTLRGMLGYGHR